MRKTLCDPTAYTPTLVWSLTGASIDTLNTDRVLAEWTRQPSASLFTKLAPRIPSRPITMRPRAAERWSPRDAAIGSKVTRGSMRLGRVEMLTTPPAALPHTAEAFER